jgi:transposase
MLPHHPTPPQSTELSAAAPARVGVGIDTSRYGHYAAFLRDDLQPAAAELCFPESAAGYAQFRQRLEQIAQRQGAVHFVIRVDAAGQYADNLLHFLHGLGRPAPVTGAEPTAAQTWRVAAVPFAVTLSAGDPQRNKNYRAALFGNKKSDSLEARAAARYALSERPAATGPLSQELRILRQGAARLQAACRQRTRLSNQLHHLLALAFPELALLVKDISTGWVLELVHRYPTAQLLAAAEECQLADIPYLPDHHIAGLLQHARTSIASLQGPAIEELLRDQVRQLRDVRARHKRLEKLVVSAYHALPKVNHLDTIPGIGDVTAAVLTAVIADIERFQSPNHLVAYFGTLPIEVASGVDRDGQPRGPKRYVMSRRGNDLVRRYLWMAALSAVRCNPAVRALYARVVAKHPDQKAIAVGHAMRKLLHLVFAVWKTGRPFAANHYPWHAPAHRDGGGRADADLCAPETAGSGTRAAQAAERTSNLTRPQDNQAAGLRDPDVPERKEVTAAWVLPSLPQDEAAGDSSFIDFVHLKRQLPLARVLDQLGLSARLRGKGPQRRCPCPIHRGDNRGQSFSVNLSAGVFCCHDKNCGQKGDVIDLWAGVHGLSLRDAALDLVRTFHLDPAP